ncbi:hypothetical protein TNCV_4684921 [Trichonephila clavipes]|nr:hypothetical protein TNCV_4684921 [Trichonephila clavipes]
MISTEAGDWEEGTMGKTVGHIEVTAPSKRTETATFHKHLISCWINPRRKRREKKKWEGKKKELSEK